jgi:phosphatidylserine/phosphatidylglycerophosphate/cardiolipin synthase-like enzyme
MIYSPELAKNLSEDFDNKFIGRDFRKNLRREFDLKGIPCELFLQNGGKEDTGCEQRLLDLVLSATASVHFMAFNFSLSSLGEAILSSARRGIDVQGIFEKVGSETQNSELAKLHCAGVAVYQDGNPRFMHENVLIIDNQIVTSGSSHFSHNSLERNNSNLLILHHPQVAAVFSQRFSQLLSQASRPDNIDCEENPA